MGEYPTARSFSTGWKSFETDASLRIVEAEVGRCLFQSVGGYSMNERAPASSPRTRKVIRKIRITRPPCDGVSGSGCGLLADWQPHGWRSHAIGKTSYLVLACRREESVTP